MSSRHEAIEKAARVAVPVETLREAVSTLSDLYMERGDERCAKAHNALSKLLCVTAPPPVDWQAEARKAAVAIYAAEVGREGLEGVDLKRQAIMATEHVAVLIAAMRANPKEFGT